MKYFLMKHELKKIKFDNLSYWKERYVRYDIYNSNSNATLRGANFSLNFLFAIVPYVFA